MRHWAYYRAREEKLSNYRYSMANRYYEEIGMKQAERLEIEAWADMDGDLLPISVWVK